MKNKDRGEVDQELLASLRAADPASGPELDDWPQSDAGREVFARIVSRRQEEEVTPRRSRVLRPVLVAAGALVVIAACVVGAALELRGAGKAVDRTLALEGVVHVAEAVAPNSTVEWPGGQGSGPAAALAARAEYLGIILPAEREFVVASGSVSRGTYALWLWRGLGDRLTAVRKAGFVDLDSLSDEMRQAVIGVAEAGIMDGRSDDRFDPGAALTVEEEKEAVSRVETAVGLSGS